MLHCSISNIWYTTEDFKVRQELATTWEYCPTGHDAAHQPAADRNHRRGAARGRRRRGADASRGARGPSAVANGENLVAAHAARGLDLDRIPFGLADQRPCDRRVDRNLAALDVGLVVADDLVGAALATLGILDVHRGAEHHPPVRVDLARVDHLRVGELGLDLGDAAF